MAQSRPPAAGLYESFIEKFLLAIIDAHTPDGRKTDQQQRMSRLADAIKALFGDKPYIQVREISDRSALRWMAEQRIKDRTYSFARKTNKVFASTHTERKIRSVRQLAREATQLTVGHSETAIEDRLRRKFSKIEKTFLEQMRCVDDVELEFEMQDLKSLQEILLRYGIKMKIGNPLVG